MFWIKFSSLLSNFLPFGIYMLILSFTETNIFVLRIILSIVVIIQIILAFTLTISIKNVIKHYSYSDSEYRIIRISRDRTSPLNFFVTNIFPLIAFDFNNTGLIVFTIIMIFIIAILFIRNNLYLYNPFIELFNWKLYNIKLEKNDDNNSNNIFSKTYITNIVVPINSTIKIKDFEDDICF